MKLLKKHIKGFTLVEFIIAVTIVSILLTIAFLSFKNYFRDARDGTRVTSIGNIQSGLEIESTVTGKYPDPDKKDGQTLLQTGALSISGSIIEYSYLGVVGDSVTKQLSLTKVPTDPLTGDKYIYTKTIDGRKYQVASILENPTSYKNNLVKQANAGNDGYVAKVEGNHKDIVIQQTSSGKYITVVPSLVFDPSGSNILNQTGTLSIVNNKGNLPYSPSKSSSILNTTNAEQLIKEIRNNNLATTATLKLPDGVTLDGSGVLNEWWILNKNGTNWNTYSSGVILASLGSVGVDGGADYTKLTAILNGWSVPDTITTQTTTTTPSYNIGNSLRFNGSSSYLSMKPPTDGNRKTWTFSTWVKRSKLGTQQYIFHARPYPYVGPDNSTDLLFNTDDSLTVQFAINGVYTSLTTSQVFRDTSNWQNLVLKVDTTGSNIVSLFVDGKQIRSFSGTATYPASDSNTSVNYSSVLHKIGVSTTSMNVYQSYFDGYLSDINLVDSGALDPTSFGQFDTNGRWIPKAYTGSYGTNGFHLDFSSGATTSTGMGKDRSGNNNDWTPYNFNSYDQMLDSPTNNFATLNPLDKILPAYSKPTLNNGNKTITANTTAWCNAAGTIATLSGKYYFRVKVTAQYGNGYIRIGIVNKNNGNEYFWTSDGTTNLGGGTLPTYTVNDIIGFAFDSTSGVIWAEKNGTWVKGATLSEIENGNSINAVWILGNGNLLSPMITVHTSPSSATLLSQENEWGISAPAGFKTLSTKNITYPIENPKQHFDVLTWTGNNANSRTITGLLFKPDLVWGKSRNKSYNHYIIDSVRGANNTLSSNQSIGEFGISGASSGYIGSLDSNGFTVQSGSVNINNWNENNTTYVSWNWRAGGTSTTNNDGTIQSQVSLNKEAGFSIVKYTGNGNTGSTIGHLLGTIPKFIIIKNLNPSGTPDWAVYHANANSSPASGVLGLNGPYGFYTTGGPNLWWNNTNPTSTGITLGNSPMTNESGKSFIAYVWSEVPGYSKFGSYTGNGSSTGDGPFVYTGFKPRFVMIKRVDTTSTVGWLMWDGVRNTFNPIFSTLKANLSNSETGDIATPPLDYLSNGFKLRDPGSDFNSLGGTYIYVAFAELPFK